MSWGLYCIAFRLLFSDVSRFLHSADRQMIQNWGRLVKQYVNIIKMKILLCLYHLCGEAKMDGKGAIMKHKFAAS